MAENININVSTPTVDVSGEVPNVSITTSSVFVDAAAATTNVEVSVGGLVVVETFAEEPIVEIELTSPQVTVTTLNQPPNGVQRIIPGINTTVSPASGIGNVTINAAGSVSNLNVAAPLSTALFFNLPTSTPQLTIQNATAPTTQFLRGDGIWAAPSSSTGTITSVTAGVGLGAPATGNSITTTGTINLLPAVGSTTIGGVKAGANVTIALDGTISSLGSTGASWTAPANIAVGDIVFAASPIAVQPGATQVFSGLAGGGGVIWSQRIITPNALDFSIVGFGVNFWVALAPGRSTAYSSPDGNRWTSRFSTNLQYTGIAANATVMIISGSGGQGYQTTTDGITFTAIFNLPLISDWSSVAFGNGVFVMVSSTTGTIAASSTTGTSGWTQRTLSTSGSWTQLAFGAGIFVTVSSNSANASTSPDGITWTTRTLPVSSFWQGVAFANGLFVLVGSGVVYSSPDAITWTLRSLPITLFAAASWRLAAGNNSFVILNTDTFTPNTIYTSGDGITWVERFIPDQTQWLGIGFGQNAFIAVGRGDIGKEAIAAKSPALNALYAFPTATIAEPSPCVAGTYKLLGGNQQFDGSTDGLWVRTA